jgi:hypothetical protein
MAIAHPRRSDLADPVSKESLVVTPGPVAMAQPLKVQNPAAPPLVNPASILWMLDQHPATAKLQSLLAITSYSMTLSNKRSAASC